VAGIKNIKWETVRPLLWAVAGIIVLSFVYHQPMKPRDALLPNPYSEAPDYDQIAKRITGATLQEDLDQYLKFGYRFTGSEGCDKLADDLIQRLKSLGYRVLIQEHEVVVPKTLDCRILGEDGEPIPNMRVYPWYPNRLRTHTIPPSGITGKVVFKGQPDDQDKIAALDDCAGNIMLLRARERFEDYANFGARAVLYFDDKADDTKPGHFTRKESHASVNVPLLYVEGDAKSLVGRAITLQCRVDWTPVTARNIIAVLDPDPNFAEVRNETLLLSAYYDSWSSIPDIAPGARQAIGLQSLMLTAENLAQTKNRNKIRRKVVLFLQGGHGQANAGSRQLIGALGTQPKPKDVLEQRDKERKEFEEELSRLMELEGLAPLYFDTVRTRSQHRAFWAGKSKLEDLFRQELSYVLDARAAKTEDEALAAKVAWLRSGAKPGRELAAFLAANKKMQVYQSLVNARPYELTHGGGYVHYFEPDAAPAVEGAVAAVRPPMDEPNYDAYLAEHIRALKERITFRIKRNRFYLRQIAQDAAIFEEIRGKDGKREVAGIEINFTDKTKQLVVGSGGYWWAARCVPADREFLMQFMYAQEKLNPLIKDKMQSVVPDGDTQACGLYYEITYFHTATMVFNGFTSFALLTKGDNREFVGCIKDTPKDINWDNVVDQARITVAGIEQIALGGAKFMPISMPVWGRDFDGQVTSIRGTSVVPNHREPNCVVQLVSGYWSPASWVHFSNGGGYWSSQMDPYPLTMSDELGRFRFRNAFAQRWMSVQFHAARTDPVSGDITWTRDLAYEAKYPTENVRVYQIGELTRIIVFRCTPVHVFKAENPKKMKLYDRVEARLVRGFSAPKRFFYEQFYAGEYVLYLEPDAIFFPTCLFGAPHNESLLRVSAVCLNIGPDEFKAVREDQEELEGKGYLAADATFLYHPEDDLARSMSAINTRRELRYRKYNLLDEPTLQACEKARQLARDAQTLRDTGKHYEAFNKMKESLAYSMSVHPVIRDSKAEAVYGIVFYLMLLIPFAFFTEKLLFGDPDIRRQLLIVGVIFLAVFLALREIHPAFEIVRSSFMILLGFLTLILSLLVTFFVSSKFRSALMEYQKIVHGQQTVAEVTKTGAAFTGFVLGINNMRKRKVRTALTATTLVLITFVMICFTAVENDYVEVVYPIGKAPYTGIEVRRNTLSHLGTQTTVLVNAFENDFDVSVRLWDVAGLWGIMPLNKKMEVESYISPDEINNLPVTLVREVDGKTLKYTSAGSLGVGPAPDFKPDEFVLVTGRWPKTESEKSCVLPVTAARQLGITPEMLQGDGPYPTVSVQGRQLQVINLFDGAKLDTYRNRKDEPITPIDFPAEQLYKKREQEEKAAQRAAEAAAKTAAGPDAKPQPLTPQETKATEEPEHKPARLAAGGIVIFPKQRQPKPDSSFSNLKAKLRLPQKEPVNFDRMFITKIPSVPEDKKHQHYWFREDDPNTCFIPGRMAAELKITPEKVETSKVEIMHEGTVLTVKGIYDGRKFDQVHDLDGEVLAPYDVESIVGRPSEEGKQEDEMPEMMKRLSGDDIIICNNRSTTSGWHVPSIAINLDKLGSHKRVRELIDRYLEKTGAKAFYGIGDMSYFGARFRRPRGSNYLELLIPLLIASLTVLNTMRGSVYERRDEIYVYNAVGLNPFHIFFLFIAEACVYAVVGALGGYLVANFTGKLIRLVGWEAGLTINYSSIYAVMYSVVIMIAVLVSTWFPARAAARLAAPADAMKWRIPDPKNGVISFPLPFTFSYRDRVAIVAYLMAWFDEFGEGSSGKFHAAPPACRLERAGGQPATVVRVTTWLRPYDLGISQEACIHFRDDPVNEQAIAHLTLTHLSGDISSWQRANYLFLRLLRKQFLGWRVVPDEEKDAFLERARQMLQGGDEATGETAAKQAVVST